MQRPRPRIQITGVTVLILLAIGGLGYGIYDRYTPRRVSFGHAIDAGDTADMARWLRRHPGIGERPLDGAFYPIDAAASGGSADVVRVLLDYGVPTRLPGCEPMTVLHATATSHVTADVVKLLIDAGEDPAAIDEAGRTPLHWLAMTPRRAQRANFEERQYDGVRVFRQSPEQYRLVAVAAVLIDRGCPVDAADLDGDTPLSTAIAHHSLVLADYLIERGADVKRPMRRPQAPLFSLTEADDLGPFLDNLTPLHNAIWNREPREVLRWLLDHGAPLDATADYRARESDAPRKLTPRELAVVLDNKIALELIDAHTPR